MKLFFSIVLVAAAIMAGTRAQIIECDVCFLEKPDCPAGEVSTEGVSGCWGCCRPICRTVCINSLSDIAIGPPCLIIETQQPSPVSAPPPEVCYECCLPSVVADSS
ncbi:hypothetical protein CPB84DRAFT_1762342 [Gymnopilus junonius]|uniref:4Fe-4S ferredoxin-type domain-containing protein n=1 Tax=Gymnopilus junonius TaxID=109634 RepID=A0A9P5NZ50_GYMJU|nr:hypothetical protein CPB84DRAFT_1762342 [Gymnopilus junonius]